MSSSEDRMLVAKRFVEEWQGKGQEDEDDQTFWNQFLQEVMGIARVHHAVNYQKKVRVGKSVKRIDGYIDASKVLIEQKSCGIDLSKPGKQSDGEMLTPFEQAKRYASCLKLSEQPRWIVTSNFQEFRIYDMESDPNGDDPVIVELDEVPNQLPAFGFISDPINAKVARQEKVNTDAAKLIGDLYGKIAAQYKDIDASRRDIAVLMVRILFCLYAEDSGLFETNLFYIYLQKIPAGEGQFRRALIDLFETLDTPEADRDEYMGETLKRFPYVDGGLFAGDIEIPIFTEDIKFELLQKTGYEFDWSEISPVIFGSIFESILSGDERRAGGMHYTSPENIHKVIDPLFLDDLREEYQKAGESTTKLRALQDKMAALKFLDPACGSGNFLTETYLELRHLENEIIERLVGEQMTIDFSDSYVKVNVGQFYGIEINDFAVCVAATALWIADHQANIETTGIIKRKVVNLPLKEYHHIVQGNALRMDWNDVIPANECSYIMGNPPFVGHQWRNEQQQHDMDLAFEGFHAYGKLDYVCAWYADAMRYIGSENIHCAFVSTNSICQGESVGILWKPLFLQGLVIEFARTSFVWNSETSDQAHVHVIIVGFCTTAHAKKVRRLFYQQEMKIVDHINGYLVDAPDVFIANRSKPCNLGAPEMTKGSQPTDGGYLILSADERANLLDAHPDLADVIRPFIGGREFINNLERYCLWFSDVDISNYAYPEIRERLKKVAEIRAASPTASVREAASTPALFTQNRQPKTDYLALPVVSSGNRKYIPVGYMSNAVVASDQLRFIPTENLFIFGLLLSSAHMAWMRVVSGRLKSDYRYSPAVYNSFVFPACTLEQRSKIEDRSRNVLKARAAYPGKSLADLYDPDNEYFFPELAEAHRELDRAVERAYGVDFNGDEEKIVAHLFKLYAEKIKELETNK